jgi:Beta-lactamase class C and other penicillin binding proteins
MTAACTTTTQNTTGGLKRATPESVGMNPQKLAQVDREIEAAIEYGTMPGAVVGVVRGDKLVYLKAYGNKAVVPDTIPMTTETMFDMASVSKCVSTTISIMQLIENGYLRLTDEVDMYIPDFQPWVDPVTGEKVDITIQDLMTHTSGLSPYIATASYLEKYGENSPDSLIKHIATEIKRNFRPKTDYTYSCLNFITLQNVLQNITGERLCDYAQKNIFDALGLKHTCYLPKAEHPELMQFVAPTEVQEDGLPLLGEVHDPMARLANAGNSGNAGVFSNVEDLAVIAAAIMNGGEVNGKRILSPMAVETMATVPSDNDPEVGRALGWDNRSSAAGLRGDLFSRTRTICHTGYTGTSMIMDLDSKTAVILLTHRVHPVDQGGTGKVRARVANIVAGSIEK